MPIKVIREFVRNEKNARNSEGAFARLQDGRIAFAYSKYRSGYSDDSSSDIAVSFSSDNGNTFTDGEVVIKCEEMGGTNLMSVSLLECENGEIAVFYLKKQGSTVCQMFMRKTIDFKTFTDEIQCIRDNGYFVVNNDRVVRLSSGRVIIPTAYVPIGKDGKYGIQTAEFYASDDDCQSFYLLSSCSMPHKISKTGHQEPGILEYEKGKVVMFSRNDTGRQYIAYSDNNCESWTVPEPSRFQSPCAPLSMKKLKDGRVIAVYNPIPIFYGRSEKIGDFWNGGRTPLILSACKSNINDEYKVIPIEEDENRGYCYTAIYELEDKILLGYCNGGIEDKCCLNRLRLTSIDKSELE